MVSGTVAANAAARVYTVTVTANDGTNDAVRATFTITINTPPSIMWSKDPSDGPYVTTRGAVTILSASDPRPSFTVSDPDRQSVTVSVSGLPRGMELSDSDGTMFQGGGAEKVFGITGYPETDAESRVYTVTARADDGTDVREMETTFIVQDNTPPTIGVETELLTFRRGEIPRVPDPQLQLSQRSLITLFTVTDPNYDLATISVTDLPPDLTILGAFTDDSVDGVRVAYGQRRLGGAPGEDVLEEFKLVGSVADDAPLATYYVVVRVDDGNNRPVVNPRRIEIRITE